MPLADMPQGNKMHAVPQNIMDVEFKLIGDLTIRQFIYLIIFGGLAYVTSVIVVGVFKWPIVLSSAILGIGLAFVPIQERGLDEWIVNFIKAVYSPTQRIWLREPQLPSAFMYDNLDVVKQELITLAPTSSRRKLEEYLEYQLADTVVDPLDIPEKEYVKKVREAFADYVPTPSAVGVAVVEPQVPYQMSPSPTDLPQEETEVPQEPQEQPQALQEVKISQTQSVPSAQQSEVAASPSQDVVAPPAPVADVVPTPVSQPVKPLATQPEPSSVVKSVVAPPTRPQPVHQQTQVKKPRPQMQPQRAEPAIRQRSSISLSPMTPDMHSGRRFTNLVPTSGELVLPIRGERVIKTSDEIEVEDDIREKAKRLEQLLTQIKHETGVRTEPSVLNTSPVSRAAVVKQLDLQQPKSEKSTSVDSEAQSLASTLKNEDMRLSQEISKLEEQKVTATNSAEAAEKDALIHRLQLEKERTHSDYEALQRQLLELQNKIKEQESANVSQQKISPVMPSFVTSAPVLGKANVIQGVVKNKDGAGQSGLLLIVKNQKGEAVRAFKTNSLGQFKLTTPVANGLYTVEVASEDAAMHFDIISVEAKGEPIPDILIVAK